MQQNYSLSFKLILQNRKDKAEQRKQVIDLITSIASGSENSDRFYKKWQLSCHTDRPIRDFSMNGEVIVSKDIMLELGEHFRGSDKSGDEAKLEYQHEFVCLLNASQESINKINSSSMTSFVQNIFDEIRDILNNPVEMTHHYTFTFRGVERNETYDVPEHDMKHYIIATNIHDMLYPSHVQKNHSEYAASKIDQLKKIAQKDPEALARLKISSEDIDKINKHLGGSNDGFLELIYTQFLAGPYQKPLAVWPLEGEKGIKIYKHKWEFNIPAKKPRYVFNRFSDAIKNILISRGLSELSENFPGKGMLLIGAYIAIPAIVGVAWLISHVVIDSVMRKYAPAIVGLLLMGAININLFTTPSALLLFTAPFLASLWGKAHFLAKKFLTQLANDQKYTYSPPAKHKYIPQFLYELQCYAWHPLKQILLSPYKDNYENSWATPLRSVLGVTLSLIVAITHLPMYAASVIAEKAVLAYLWAPSLIVHPLRYTAEGVESVVNAVSDFATWMKSKFVQSNDFEPEPDLEAGFEQTNELERLTYILPSANVLHNFRHQQDVAATTATSSDANDNTAKRSSSSSRPFA